MLADSWRYREAYLLRFLSARNLDTIRKTFEYVCSSTGREGLNVVEFVIAMMHMFADGSASMFDKLEFAIQTLELFAAIDVRDDGRRSGSAMPHVAM